VLRLVETKAGELHNGNQPDRHGREKPRVTILGFHVAIGDDDNTEWWDAARADVGRAPREIRPLILGDIPSVGMSETAWYDAHRWAKSLPGWRSRPEARGFRSLGGFPLTWERADVDEGAVAEVHEAGGAADAELYDEVIRLGIPYDSHESDLYIPVTPETEALIGEYEFRSNVTRFESEGTLLPRGMWFDIPFAYAPWWRRRAAREAAPSRRGTTSHGDQVVAILASSWGAMGGAAHARRLVAKHGRIVRAESDPFMAAQAIINREFADEDEEWGGRSVGEDPGGESNFDVFMRLYADNLHRAVSEHPDEYPWPIENVPVVVERMAAAIQRGSYNKDGYAFKWTAKQLGIPHTYKAINAFLVG